MFRFLLVVSLLLCNTIVIQAKDKEAKAVQKAVLPDGLKGPVKSVTQERWRPSKDSTIYSSVPLVTLNSTYSLVQSKSSMFDEHGRLTRWTLSEPDGSKSTKLKEQVWLAYYTGDRMTATAHYDEGKLADSVYSHYRRNGWKDYELSFDGKRDLALREDFVYKNGVLFSRRKRDAKGQPVTYEKQKYKDGRLAEVQHFDGTSKRTDTWRFSYQTDADGNLNTSYSITGGDDKLRSGRTERRDSSGHILETNDISDEREVTEYNSFTYNSHGDPETEKLFNSAVERTTTNRYLYDEQGNWTKREVFYNGILYAIDMRTIEYYTVKP